MTTVNTDPPSLDHLTRRLAETPEVFWGEPVIRGKGDIHVDAMMHDLLRALGNDRPELVDLRFFKSKAAKDRNFLRMVAVTAWLLHDDWFVSRGCFARAALTFCTEELNRLRHLVDAEQFILDADRREELVRRLLRDLGVTPDDESENQAADRLKSLDSIERARLMREAAEARERQRQLEEEMRRKAAEEAAARYHRE